MNRVRIALATLVWWLVVLLNGCGSVSELPDEPTPCQFSAPTADCATVDVTNSTRTWLCETPQGYCTLVQHALQARPR